MLLKGSLQNLLRGQLRKCDFISGSIAQTIQYIQSKTPMHLTLHLHTAPIGRECTVKGWEQEPWQIYRENECAHIRQRLAS